MNTKVPVWTHESIGYPKWTSAIGMRQFTMVFNLPNIVIKPDLVTILQTFPPLYCLALRLKNTKVPVWTNESIGYPKMDISYWDAAIHYGLLHAQYCDQTRSCKHFLQRFLPLYSLALRLRNTNLPVWTHESKWYPKWTSALGTRQFTMAFSSPNFVIKPDLVTLLYGDRPLCTPLP